MNNIPEQLANRDQWILWRDEDGRKVPYNPRTGKPAKSNDPSTWASLEVAKASPVERTGLGFVFAEDDDLFGVDLDSCLDEQGYIADWADEVIKALDTYAEISPSGNGIKLFGRGWKGPGRKKTLGEATEAGKAPGIEIYSQGRYFTFTGHKLQTGQTEVLECGDGARWLVEKYWPEKQPVTTPVTTPAAADGPLDVEQRARAYLATLEPAISGQRGHDVTFRAACKLVLGFNLPPERAAPLLAEWNQTCQPPWDEKELLHKLTSADKQTADRGYLLDWDAETDIDPQVDLSGILGPATAKPAAISPTKKLIASFPQECLQPPGLLSEIIDYNLETSMYPQAPLALAGALCLLSVLLGRKVQDDIGTRPNIMCVGLAPTAAGKEWARKINKRLLYQAGCDAMLGPERIGSHAGVVTHVSETPSLLFQLDEFGRFMESVKSASGTSMHLKHIITVLMTLYTSSDDVWVSDAYADSKKTKKINQPHAVVYGVSTADKMWESLSTDNVSDGFLNRLMVFECARVKSKHPEQTKPPERLLEAIREWGRFAPGGNLDSQNPEPVTVAATPEARARMQEHILSINSRHELDDKNAEYLWCRSAEKAGKLALLFACSRARLPSEASQITIDDMNLAIRLSNWLTRYLVVRTDENVSENETERLSKRMLRTIRTLEEEKGAPITSSELTHKTRWVTVRQRNEIVAGLEEAERVFRWSELSKGRKPRQIYSTSPPAAALRNCNPICNL